MANNQQTRAVVVRAFYKGEEFSVQTNGFKYSYSEEGDEECILDVREKDRNAPSFPRYQEGAEITITWGYIGSNEMSKTRKVYIQDPKWNFAEDLVKGTLTCGEKAISLKQESSATVHKQTNLLQALDTIAAKHDLVPGFEDFEEALGQGDLAFLKSKTNEAQYKFILKGRKVPLDPTQINVTKGILKPEDLTASQEAWKNVEKALGKDPSPEALANYFTTQKNINRIAKNFKEYTSLPQGNKSDSQFLNQMASNEPGGPYIVDTRDDMITVKRRNFNQPSYRTYTYGDDSELIEFVPESKNKVKKGASDSIGFSGWDKTNKDFFVGDANVLNDPNVAAISKWRAIWRDLGKKDPNAIFDKQFAGAAVRVSGSVANKQQNADGDNTNVVTNLRAYRTITVAQARDVLGNILESYSKSLIDSRHSNPVDAFHAATNARNRAELERNPASARVVMDPSLEVGKIITFLGVSAKYSGNYYIVKCDHVVSPNGYAYCELELVSQGNNIKVNNNFLPSDTKLKHNVNTTIGPKKPTPRKTAVKIKK